MVLGVPNNKLICMEGQKTLSFSYNMHLFLPYLLNDSQTIRSTIHSSKPLLCVTLICSDWSDWSIILVSIFVQTESLESMFQWLGFEVVTKLNCARHQILQVLRDLAARDHTSTDCVVCCVLSHGQIKGIFGVDGQIVTYGELIETLGPSQCPSLFKKPKLFFIQACRGTEDQPAAFPQIFPDDEVMPVSDAAVPRDSIPEMADYLLAMSTVPHYVSYREKDNGSWFIQSLCHNLKLLVPRWASLSIRLSLLRGEN